MIVLELLAVAVLAWQGLRLLDRLEADPEPPTVYDWQEDHMLALMFKREDAEGLICVRPAPRKETA